MAPEGRAVRQLVAEGLSAERPEVVAKEPTRVLVHFTERPDLEPEYLLRSDPRIWSGSLDSSCWHTLSQHVWEPLEEAGREGAAAPSGVCAETRLAP